MLLMNQSNMQKASSNVSFRILQLTNTPPPPPPCLPLSWMLRVIHCTKIYIPTTWESIEYVDGKVLNPANNSHGGGNVCFCAVIRSVGSPHNHCICQKTDLYFDSSLVLCIFIALHPTVGISSLYC